MRIAVLANLKQNAPSRGPSGVGDGWAELDSPATIEAIAAALRRAGHEAEFFEGDLSLVQALPAWRPDLCFNLCEGHFGDSRESHVPAILEMLRVPYTGAGVLALAVTLDKPTTKRVLASFGLPTPPFQVFGAADEPLSPHLAGPNGGLRAPLIAKPAHEGSGMGVTVDSVAADEAGLRRAIARVLADYQQPVLVERFVAGREITVGMVGNPADPWVPTGPWATLPRVGGLCVLPPYEYVLPADATYSTHLKNQWEGAWTAGVHYHCPAALTPALRAEIERVAVATFRATGCRDVARVDLRVDDEGRPYVLEINALPGLSPGWSDLVLEAQAAGIDYDGLIVGITDAARRRLA